MKTAKIVLIVLLSIAILPIKACEDTFESIFLNLTICKKASWTYEFQRPYVKIKSPNLKSFINSGYDHMHITPNAHAMRELNKFGFIEKGFPYYGWLIAIHTAVIKTAVNFKIPLLFYGEDGEIEYGGSAKNKNKAI